MSKNSLFQVPRFLFKPKAKIFISYRRDDAAGQVGRLSEQLTSHFGAAHVFRDIETIEAGDDFTEAINKNVSSCDAVLVVIGKQWSKGGEDGESRLNSAGDFVRLEIAGALKRQIPVIPVLVQGSSMPNAKDLPEDLENLAKKQAFDLSEARWTYDVNQLIGRLERVLPPPTLLWPRVLLTVLCFLALALGAGWLTKWALSQKSAQSDPVVKELERSRVPLFPMKVSVGFRFGLQHPLLASFRSRLVNAATPGEERVYLGRAGTPYPDPNREAVAYTLLKARPEFIVFLLRNPTGQFEGEPDLSFVVRPRREANDSDPSYNLKDSVLELFFQDYAVNLDDKDLYSNHTLISPLDLPGTQIVYEIRNVYYDEMKGVDPSIMNSISKDVGIDDLRLEFPGKREISLSQALFKHVKKESRDFYVYTFPNTKEEMEKLYIP